MTYDKKTKEMARAEALIYVALSAVRDARIKMSTKMAKSVNEDLSRAESLLRGAHDRVETDLDRYANGHPAVQYLAEQDIVRLEDGTLAVIKEEEE